GVRAAPGARGALCADRSSAAAGDPHHAPRLPDGAVGSPGDGEGPGATRSDTGARIFLCPAAGGRAVGWGDLAGGAAPVSGSGIPVSAGAAAAGDVHVQACAHPGCGVSVPAPEYAAAVSSAHSAGVDGAVSRDCRDPTRVAGASLHGSGTA